MGRVSQTMPAPMLRLARGAIRALTGKPQVGRVAFGDLRRTRPISGDFGYSRGLPVDRHYIERFLEAHRADVRGSILEIGEDTYTRRFGGPRVERSDILHVSDRNPRANIVADLSEAPQIPDASYDCIILTQTLQLIFRPDAAVRTLHRILRPGGVLLLTVPGTTQIASRSEWGASWYWSFTDRCIRRLLEEPFGRDRVECTVHGNVLAAIAQLQGLSATELSAGELAVTDPDYQVIVTARARKAELPA